jgi:hypothetical protein
VVSARREANRIIPATEMTVFAIDVPRMFVTNDAGKYVVRQNLRARPGECPAVWLGRGITILSGR